MVINIKNSSTCFGSTEPSSGQITRHSTGTFRKCTRYGIPYCLQIVLTLQIHHYLFYFIYTYFKWHRVTEQNMISNVDTICKQYGNPQSVHSLNVPILSVLYLAWWWFNWTETCRRIFNTDYQHMLCYWLNKLLYYCKHNGMAPIKVKTFCCHLRGFH